MTQLASLSEVHRLLNELDIRPNRKLGQNFLIDGNILDIIVAAAALSDADTVLEVGPGLGVLTEALAARAGQVLAVEKDRRLAEHLRRRFSGAANVAIIEGDMLHAGTRAQLDARQAYQAVVSNLPYSAGTRILVEEALRADRPERMVFTVQLEVADRITAEPDTPDYGMLTLWLGLYYRAERIKTVSRSCFWPRPDVRSAIVSLTRRAAVPLPPDTQRTFRILTKHAFSQRRKQLVSSLRRVPGLGRIEADTLRQRLIAAGCDPAARPGAVSLETWCRIAERSPGLG